MLDDIRWLIVRFAPGSGGKMLSALLQAAPNVASWNSTGKPFESWFKDCYPGVFDKWLDLEPKCSWNINQVISSTYPRGDDLSEQDFYEQLKEKCHLDFWKSVEDRKLIPLLWHKPHFPQFFRNKKVIDLVIDEDSDAQFVEMKMKKMFSFENIPQGVKVTYQEHRPNYRIGNFENAYHRIFSTIEEFKQTEIISNSWQKDMRSTETDVSLELKKLLAEDFIQSTFLPISNKLELFFTDLGMLTRCHLHWRKASGL